LQEGVGGALGGVEVVFFAIEGRKPETRDFGVVVYEEVVDDLSIFVEDRDETIGAALSEVVAGHVEGLDFVLVSLHGEGGGSKASRELVEDAGVEHSRRVNNHSENTVLERFGHIEDILLGVHGEASGVGEAAVDDGLEHADTQVNHEQAADGVLERALTKRSTVGEEKGVGSLGQEHGVGSL